MSDDRAADARAEEDAKNALLAERVMGWVRWHKYWNVPDDLTYGGIRYAIRPKVDYDVLYWAPDLDITAARLLMEALKPEQQARAVAILIDRLEVDPGTYSGLVGLLLAPPAAIRDAVLEAVEGGEG